MGKKIKICLFLHSLAGGGAERFIVHLSNNLSREIFDIHLLLLNAQGEYAHQLRDDIQIIDLKLGAFKLSKVPNSAVIFKVSQQFKQINPDLIFSTMTTTNLIAIVSRFWARLKIPLIIQEAGVFGDHLKFARFRNVKRFVYKSIVRFADLVIVPAQAMADDLIKLSVLKAEKLQVMPNAVDFKHIHESLRNNVVSEEISQQKKKKIIISVGRLEKIKGFDIGIRAFYELHKRMPSYYWILGQGSEEEALKKLARELGIEQDVKFFGFQQNPYLFLKNADCFLLPSRSEGHPYTLMEAMYCEVPCVVSHYSSSVAQMIRDEFNGLVVESGNAVKMAEAMERVLLSAELRSKFISNAKKSVKEYGVEGVIPQYEKLFLSYAKRINSS
jgi:glycosyltransferase involved in cell wall biosynthesis